MFEVQLPAGNVVPVHYAAGVPREGEWIEIGGESYVVSAVNWSVRTMTNDWHRAAVATVQVGKPQDREAGGGARETRSPAR